MRLITDEEFEKIGFLNVGFKTSESFLQERPWYQFGKYHFATQSTVEFCHKDLVAHDLVVFINRKNGEYRFISVIMFDDISALKMLVNEELGLAININTLD